MTTSDITEKTPTEIPLCCHHDLPPSPEDEDFRTLLMASARKILLEDTIKFFAAVDRRARTDSPALLLGGYASP